MDCQHLLFPKKWSSLSDLISQPNSPMGAFYFTKRHCAQVLLPATGYLSLAAVLTSLKLGHCYKLNWPKKGVCGSLAPWDITLPLPFCQHLGHILLFGVSVCLVALCWCQIVRVPNGPVPNFLLSYLGAKLPICFLGAKLSVFTILSPNCPCHIVRVPNYPVPNCPTTHLTALTDESLAVMYFFKLAYFLA